MYTVSSERPVNHVTQWDSNPQRQDRSSHRRSDHCAMRYKLRTRVAVGLSHKRTLTGKNHMLNIGLYLQSCHHYVIVDGDSYEIPEKIAQGTKCNQTQIHSRDSSTTAPPRTGVTAPTYRVDFRFFTFLRPSQNFFNCMETSPLPVIYAYARRSGPLSREGSLSCLTCCDTGPRFFRSYPKDRPIQS
jgi:hypothetical protein